MTQKKKQQAKLRIVKETFNARVDLNEYVKALIVESIENDRNHSFKENIND